MRQNLSVEEALEAILAQVGTYDQQETVGLEQGLGRVLAQDLVAKVSHPDQDDTSMDGYAVRHADTLGATSEHPVGLQVIGEAPAGKPFSGAVGPNQAVRIFTGAPIPLGANAVARVEDTRREGEKVWLLAPANPGDIRRSGDDFKQGQTLLQRGQALTAGRLGLAAAMGYPDLPVFCPPRVGVLTTGDEVVEPGQPLPFGGVYNANSYTVAALLRQAGAEPVMLGQVPDRLDSLRERLALALPLHALVTSGGVSMGEYDLVRKLLEQEGHIHFWKVRLQPGGPLLFAEWNHTTVFGLPGNPVATMVTFFLFVRPFLFKLLGRTEAPYQTLSAVAQSRFGANPSKVAFRRGVLSQGPQGWQVHSTGNQSSGVLRSMAEGNALVRLEAAQNVEVGQKATVIPLGFVL